MKILMFLYLLIYKLLQISLRFYRTNTQLSSYCALLCRDFEVGYLPAETLVEIKLLRHRENPHGY